MIEVIDGATFEVLGCKYSQDERAAALFSVELYSGQLAAGRISEDPAVLSRGVKVVEQIKQLLSDEPDVFKPAIHTVLRDIFLKLTVDLDKSIPNGPLHAELYKELCAKLGVTPFELFTNALTANALLKGKMTQQQFVGFDPSIGE